MKKLTVIIVNYNVKHFLEQCLYAVRNSSQGIDKEVIVVDNNSVDGSIAMLREKFPDIHLIRNKENKGFSAANNQAIRQAKGEFILLLNPDTVVEETTFEKIIAFMEAHPDAGGLGVKMIDGNGRYLPESKRALPKPWVAFYKVFGFSRLFPSSKKFGRYHLSYLDKDQIHEVEVLAGAFMLLRKSVLEKTGLLDESFFMYGEDIDLSYRIIKAGYKNYYFPDTTIIHYKGESTKKSSINYVLIFYKAMLIFARKHFSKNNAKIFAALIKSAIYLRAVVSIGKRFLLNIFLPVMDAAIIYTGFYIIKPFWEQYKFPEGGAYPPAFLHYIVPAYIIIWVVSILLSGGYFRPVRIIKLLQGIGTGTLIILVLYALLPENLRFSRALILIGTAWTLLSTVIFRLLLHFLQIKELRLKANTAKRIIIVGENTEAERIHNFLKQINIKSEIVGYVSTRGNGKTLNYIGEISQLHEIVKINKINEIIFSGKDIPSRQIIQNMHKLAETDVNYKIAPPESLSIIGSNSINTEGDLYLVQINSIAKERNKRNKRIFDVCFSVIILLISPILIFFTKNPKGLFKNAARVIPGNYSWVGYARQSKVYNGKLPELKKGILNTLDKFSLKNMQMQEKIIEKIDVSYAKDYRLYYDVIICFRNIKHLGRAST